MIPPVVGTPRFGMVLNPGDKAFLQGVQALTEENANRYREELENRFAGFRAGLDMKPGYKIKTTGEISEKAFIELALLVDDLQGKLPDDPYAKGWLRNRQRLMAETRETAKAMTEGLSLARARSALEQLDALTIPVHGLISLALRARIEELLTEDQRRFITRHLYAQTHRMPPAEAAKE